VGEISSRREAARLDGILRSMAAKGKAWAPASGERAFLEGAATDPEKGVRSRAALLAREVLSRLGADPDLFSRPEWRKLPEALASHAFVSFCAGPAGEEHPDGCPAVLEFLAGAPAPEILAALGRSLAGDARLDIPEWKGRSLAQIVANGVWEARTLYREAYPPESLPALDAAWKALKSEPAWNRPEGIRSRLLIPLAALSGFLPADPAIWAVTGTYAKLNGTLVRLSVLAAAVYSGRLQALPEGAADLQLERTVMEESSLGRRGASQLPRHAAAAFLFCGDFLGDATQEDLGPEAVRDLIAGRAGPGYLRRILDQAEKYRALILETGLCSRKGEVTPLTEVARLCSREPGGRQSAVALALLLVLAAHPELLSAKAPGSSVAVGIESGCGTVAAVAERFLFPCVALWHNKAGNGSPESLLRAPLLAAAAALLGRAEARGIPLAAGGLPGRLAEILLPTYGPSGKIPLEEAIRSAIVAAVASQALFGSEEPDEVPLL
jgi:hypothetical protein